MACFTETPLEDIHRLVEPNPGRKYQLEAYGFVFYREFLIERGAEQVVPLNGYGSNDRRRRLYDRMYNQAVREKFVGDSWRALAFADAMHGGYDFGWEREWRLLGSLSFDYDYLVCVVLPKVTRPEIRNKLASIPVPVYTPGMGVEEIMIQARFQQRRVRRMALAERDAEVEE